MSQWAVREVAQTMLALNGLAIIWELHIVAAAAYERGDGSAAEALLEIAEVVTEEWLRRHPDPVAD
jgi:hypothetical protein